MGELKKFLDKDFLLSLRDRGGPLDGRLMIYNDCSSLLGSLIYYDREDHEFTLKIMLCNRTSSDHSVIPPPLQINPS